MTSQTGKVILLAFACAVALFFLYLFQIDGMGLVGPDEPRYATIGREMARSGDWITPRLWGVPWFEKPPLLYWMTAVANLAGLGPDLAPRLPVALLSCAFLILFFLWLRREWGWEPASYASAILASSAAWVAYSQSAVVDLPLAATFSTAVLLALPWVETGDRRQLPIAGALLGVAVLAKGLVPLVLVLPLFWLARRRWKDLLRPAVLAPFSVVALPWYLLCTMRNGLPFLRTFFLEHTFGRFSSDALQHGQPFWFYVPVLLASVFPWTVLLFVLVQRPLYRERHAAPFAAIVLWGFVFFSLSHNKLGGYLLPLLPSLAALLGMGLYRSRSAAPWLVFPVIALAWVPVVGALLPVAIESGIRRAWPVPLVVRFRAALLMLPLMLAGVCGLLADRWHRRYIAVAAIFAMTVFSVAWLKLTAVPEIDREASARSLVRATHQPVANLCVGTMPRAWPYALNYYFDRQIPPCPPVAAGANTLLDPHPPRVVLSH